MSNSSRPLRPGDPHELDGYRVLGRLGRGGMGTVYLAESPTGARVALKLIHPDLAEDGAFRARFAREVAAARRVARFSTAAVVDARMEGEVLFIASEYVPGPTLAAAVRADGPMRGGTLESLAVGVAAALTAVHRSGIVHRDLKPSNVLLSPVGPKVIDFGIARALDEAGDGITRSHQLIGTPSYMAPELIAGQSPTPAGDVFSWGCLIAFAGTGGAPFDAATVPGVLHNISHAAPRLDGLDPALRETVTAALGKDPLSRPSSQELLDRLVGRADPAEEYIARSISVAWPATVSEGTAPEPAAPEGAAPEAALPQATGLEPAAPERTAAETAAPQATGPEAAAPEPVRTPSETRTGSSAGGRRRLLVVACAGAAVLLSAAALVLVLLDRDGLPDDTATVYEYDFENDPDWPDLGLYHPGNSNESGYWATESGIMLVRDPEVHDTAGAAVWAPPLENAIPERLMARTDAHVISGYGQARYGIACWERYGPQDAAVLSMTYKVLVNFDGERAVIQRWSNEDESWEDMVSGPAAQDHEPFPALRGEEGTEVTNALAFACEYVETEDGSPTVELSAWVNERLVAHAVDDRLPAEAADTATSVRQFGLVMAAGPVGQHVGILFEDFVLEEILTG
ncbi:serine/threonine protein kinase [Nocardiopsis sp. Huas11]|uniref:serine/threonine-protein kinase n=1 Tax=Nocardiopsis sp. Huas11 TaxID=2183912 RepID=UPI000EADF0BD|nr:serine/threonine-protein kinase [Nocardiopsis sp. Huas11]RKS04921.1 serine/threonine protein kinase [Nocardiopsis sp. Huas11]